MRCRWSFVLDSGMFDELSEWEKKGFKEHLITCIECAQAYENVKRLSEYLKKMTEPEPISVFESAKIVSVCRKDSRISTITNIKKLWKPAFGIIVAIVLLIGGINMIRTSDIKLEERKIVEDIDFLRNLDVLEKLVQVVDRTPQDHSRNFMDPTKINTNFVEGPYDRVYV